MFCKKGVLRNFTKFTFPVNFVNFLHRTPLVAASIKCVSEMQLTVIFQDNKCSKNIKKMTLLFSKGEESLRPAALLNVLI